MNISERHANKCLRLLQKAHQDLMKNPSGKKFEDLEAVLPSSLLAIIVSHILSDFTSDQPDLEESYWEYFDQLVSLEILYHLPNSSDTWSRN
jgi:hypothetical protein